MPLYCSCTCWIPGSSRNGPVKYCLSILLSCCLSGFFLGIESLGFSEFWHGSRKPYQVVWQSQIFLEIFFLPHKLGEWAKNRGFFNLKMNLVIDFHQICSIMKICYLLGSSTNPMFGKNLVPEIQAKMLSANQMDEFLKSTLQNK